MGADCTVPMHQILETLWRMRVSGAHGWTPKGLGMILWALTVKGGCCVNSQEVKGVSLSRIVGMRRRVHGQRMCILLGLVLRELHINRMRYPAFDLSPAVIEIHSYEACRRSANPPSNVC